MYIYNTKYLRWAHRWNPGFLDGVIPSPYQKDPLNQGFAVEVFNQIGDVLLSRAIFFPWLLGYSGFKSRLLIIQVGLKPHVLLVAGFLQSDAFAQRPSLGASVAVPALHALLSVTRCWVPSAGRKNGPNLIRPKGASELAIQIWDWLRKNIMMAMIKGHI